MTCLRREVRTTKVGRRKDEEGKSCRGSKRHPRDPKTSPRAPKTSPRDTQELQKGTPEIPRDTQEARRPPQKPSRGPQEAPKGPPARNSVTFGRPTGTPKATQDEPQIDQKSKSKKETKKGHLWDPLGPLLVRSSALLSSTSGSQNRQKHWKT